MKNVFGILIINKFENIQKPCVYWGKFNINRTISCSVSIKGFWVALPEPFSDHYPPPTTHACAAHTPHNLVMTNCITGHCTSTYSSNANNFIRFDNATDYFSNFNIYKIKLKLKQTLSMCTSLRWNIFTTVLDYQLWSIYGLWIKSIWFVYLHNFPVTKFCHNWIRTSTANKKLTITV